MLHATLRILRFLPGLSIRTPISASSQTRPLVAARCWPPYCIPRNDSQSYGMRRSRPKIESTSPYWENPGKKEDRWEPDARGTRSRESRIFGSSVVATCSNVMSRNYSMLSRKRRLISSSTSRVSASPRISVPWDACCATRAPQKSLRIWLRRRRSNPAESGLDRQPPPWSLDTYWEPIQNRPCTMYPASPALSLCD